MELKDMTGVFLTLLIVGLVLSIGAIVTDGMKTKDSQSTTAEAANYTKTVTVDTPFILPFVDVISSSMKVYNVTSNTTITTGEYTLDATAGQMTVTNDSYNGASMLFDYSYNVRSNNYVILSNGTKTLTDTAAWSKTFALIIAAALIIGVVLSAFKLKRD